MLAALFSLSHCQDAVSDDREAARYYLPARAGAQHQRGEGAGVSADTVGSAPREQEAWPSWPISENRGQAETGGPERLWEPGTWGRWSALARLGQQTAQESSRFC